MKAGLIILGLVLFIGGSLFLTYSSSYNYGNSMEVLLKATQEDNKQTLAQYGEKIAEMAQVPEMYRDDIVKVTSAAIEGRYGPGGSKAVFQMLREQNPSLDVSLYKNIQVAIEAGRNDFTVKQKKLIDQKRQYETEIGGLFSGFWLKLAGYPKVNLADYDAVSTDRANEVFKTKKETPLKLR